MFRVFSLLLVLFGLLCLLAGDARAFGGRVVVRNGFGVRSAPVVVNAAGVNVAVGRRGIFGPRVVVNNGGFVQPVGVQSFQSFGVPVGGFQSFGTFNSFGVGGCSNCGVGARVLVVP